MGNRMSRLEREYDVSTSPLVARGDIESGPETNYSVLSERLEILFNKELLFKRSAQEVRDITEAVQELVRLIEVALRNIDTRFTCSIRHFVGSMAEGTRIIEPDEFDFLFIIDDLSFSDDVTWSRPEHVSSGSVHIKLDKSGNTGLWTDISANDELKSTAVYIVDDGVKEKFLKAVRTAVQTVMERGDVIVKATGSLTIVKSTVEKNGVTCMCRDCFLWSSTETASTCSTTLPISVDITAAIQTTFAKSGIERSDVADDELYNQIKDTDKVIAVPCGRLECKAGKCFKYSVATLELENMKSKLKDHFKCYMILKYLFCSTCACKRPCLHLPNGRFSNSYAIKNLLFKHVATCTNGSLGCVYNMIELMEESYHTRLSDVLGENILQAYNIKVSRMNTEYFFGMIISTDTFNIVATKRIKRTLNIASAINIPTEYRARSVEYTPSSFSRIATFKKYHFPLVFFLYILQVVCLYSITCVPVPAWLSWKSSLSHWWVLMALTLLAMLQTLVLWALYTLRKWWSPRLLVSLFFFVLVLCVLSFSLLSVLPLSVPEWLSAVFMVPTFMLIGTGIYPRLLLWSRRLLLRWRRRLPLLLLQGLVMMLFSIVLSIVLSIPLLATAFKN